MASTISFMSAAALNGVEDFLFPKPCKNYHEENKRIKEKKKKERGKDFLGTRN